MTTFRIVLRCFGTVPSHFRAYHLRTYRIDGWSREEVIKKARDAAFREGFTKTEVHYVMPAFVDEIGT